MAVPVIIVTGVSRGIGRAIAEQLQSRGAAVVGAARNVADVPATAGLLLVAADVTEEPGRKAIVEPPGWSRRSARRGQAPPLAGVHYFPERL